MKTNMNMLLAGVAVVFCCSIGNAQIIYSNNFSLGGSANIDGSAPTVANSFAGGTSTALWKDVLGNQDTNSSGSVYFGGDGTVPGTPNSLILSFTPQSGYTYILSASLTFSGNPGSWVGLGFAHNYNPTGDYGFGRFSDSTGTGSNAGKIGPDGYDWMIVTESNGNLQEFLGPHGTGQIVSQNGFFTPGPQTLSLSVVLDTTDTKWTTAYYVNGVAGPTGTYSSNPTIGAVGITENALSGPGNVQWNNLALTAEPVPEPTSMALAGIGLAGMCAFLRRRK